MMICKTLYNFETRRFDPIGDKDEPALDNLFWYSQLTAYGNCCYEGAD